MSEDTHECEYKLKAELNLKLAEEWMFIAADLQSKLNIVKGVFTAEELLREERDASFTTKHNQEVNTNVLVQTVRF
jgi:hypothetical protein